MRIAYICADLGVPVFGTKGCSIHVQEVIRALSKRGARIELFAMRPEGDRPRGLETVTLHTIPAVPKGDCAAREQAALAVNPQVGGALKRNGPFDLIYERYSLWSYAGMEYARAHGTPGLLEVNAPLIEEQAEHRSLVDRPSAEGVAERVFRDATALLAVSSQIAAYLEDRYSVTRRRVHVIPNGVDPDRFSEGWQTSCAGQPEEFTIGFVGTLKPWHGLTTLVEAFALLHPRASNTRLLIVGDGPERERLEADLSARGLREKVHFAGAVAASAVPGFLAAMDVAVAPYPSLPNFYFSPLKVYEYMAAALPVVASRMGQLAELIQHGSNGLLVSAGDPVALAAALERLWREPELADRLGQQARQTVVRAHTWDAVAQRILSLSGVESHPNSVVGS